MIPAQNYFHIWKFEPHLRKSYHVKMILLKGLGGGYLKILKLRKKKFNSKFVQNKTNDWKKKKTVSQRRAPSPTIKILKNYQTSLVHHIKIVTIRYNFCNLPFPPPPPVLPKKIVTKNILNTLTLDLGHQSLEKIVKSKKMYPCFSLYI